MAADNGHERGPAEYLTADEVGTILRLSPKTIYRLAKADPTLPMLKLGGAVRFPRERLLRWLWDREQGRPRIRKPMLSAQKLSESRGVAAAG
jgi:excisionase family DNA binding protein